MTKEIKMDKVIELMNRVLEIGEKYKLADKPTKIEVGRIMIGKRKNDKNKK